jgi:hypothetical protein
MTPTKRPASEYILDTAEAAARIPCAPATLKRWRYTGARVIPYIKPAGRCLYHPDDIDEFKLQTLATHA